MWSAFCNVVGEAIDAHVHVYSVNPHTVKKRYRKKYAKKRRARTIFGVSHGVIPITTHGNLNMEKLPGSILGITKL